MKKRYGRAKGGPLATFKTAARKIEKMIDELATGGGELHHPALAVFQAINKLEDRTNKPEIRGDDVIRGEAWAIVSDLRNRTRLAEEAGREARKAIRSGQIAAIGEQVLEERAAMTPGERALWNYQQELKLMRGR